MHYQVFLPKYKKLTSYPEGSLRELLSISLPLILSLMSTGLMLFLDRLFLSHYSLGALNAVTHAGCSVQFLQFLSMTTACIAEVFVGRFNGAGKPHKIGQPVWQMIWFSLFSFLFYIPIALFAGDWIFSEDETQEMKVTFFSFLVYFIPLASISSAVASFYVGRGKAWVVMAVMLGSNAINGIFDAVLIFGVSPWIPSLGVAGAAYATGIAQIFQTGLLFVLFIRKTNRLFFGTDQWRLNRHLFVSCLKIGFPNALAHSLEILAWVFILALMSHLGGDYMTAVAVVQSILFLFTFISEGISKGATAIASNFLGGDKHSLLIKLLISGTLFYAICFLALYPLLVSHPGYLVDWFTADTDHLSFSTLALIYQACFWLWIYFFFDGMNWFLTGILAAMGDTAFVLRVSAVAPFVFMVLPAYFFIFQAGSSPDVLWVFIALYALFTCLIYAIRLRRQQMRSVVFSQL